MKEETSPSRIKNAYGKIYRLCSKLILWAYRVHIVHPEREPDTPYLLCANHLSAADPVILCCAMKKRQVRFLSKKELFAIPLLRGFLKSIGCLPVDRSGDVGAIRTTIGLLGAGETVGIFPQGTRCPGVEPSETAQKVKGGAGLLVAKTGISVLPVRLITKGNRVKLFRRVELVLGEPLQLSGETMPVSRNSELYQHISDTIFARICALSPASAEAEAHE